MNIHLIAIVVLLLTVEAARPNLLEDADLLPEPRAWRCAKPDESCSKGRYGSGPSCCPPKGCSCNPFTRNCHCEWDSISHTASQVWDWISG